MNCAKGPEVRDMIASALKEDIGGKDITTASFIPKNKTINAILLAKEDCVVCGLAVSRETFELLDNKIRFRPLVNDGQRVKIGRTLAVLSGDARNILTAERVALNFLNHLSGVATMTRFFVDAVKPHRTKIIDTRKTTPGMRLLEKYAVRTGGGFNHRFSLDEMVLIKDNHLKVIGGINKISGFSRKYKTEIEVKNLSELKKALSLRPDIIMLDNMGPKAMKKAVEIRNKLSGGLPLPRQTPKLEASGGVTLKTVKKIAATGVDFISIGAITHSARSVDISLEVI